MIDIHHHLLYGLDDGSPDLQTSLEMCRLAVAEGITHIVCTPHANNRYPYQPEVNAEKLATLRDAIEKEGLPLTLGIGCDFHLSFDNIQSLKEHPTRYTINGKDYLLVELPDHGIARGMSEAFYEMQLAGVTPILTHPERNATLQTDLSRLANWLRGGVLVQVTAGSVTGQMGRTAERISHQLLENRWVHFIATDAHNLTSRSPQPHRAYEVITKRYGAELAERLFVDNPRAAFDGTSMPEQDEPLNLHDDLQPKSPWQRLLTRYGIFKD
jgi:protein-tyrosine phosphatase